MKSLSSDLNELYTRCVNKESKLIETIGDMIMSGSLFHDCCMANALSRRIESRVVHQQSYLIYTCITYTHTLEAIVHLYKT